MNPLDIAGRYYGVFAEGQTYLNLIYLGLAFPLGLSYFILLTVGFSLGIGLLIIWVGIAILGFTLAGAWVAVLFERRLANVFLGVYLPPLSRQIGPDPTFWEKIRTALTDPMTWKGLLFLFLKFPLGVLTFTVTVSSTAILTVMLTAPITFHALDFKYGHWQAHTLSDVFLVFLAGIALAPLVFHVTNLMAFAYAEIAKTLLRRSGVSDTNGQIN